MDSKEKRVRAITKLYYSNPKIQEAILEFSRDREVVPSYMMEHFGKRPDVLQYTSDVMGAVNKGATSFHASEELWKDPLQINADMPPSELEELRKGWDLLIDIDSPFLDCSKIAAKLIIAALEQHGIKNYGIKFSGSKGFHLILSGRAFPKHFNGKETRKMFPGWARAISEYLMHYIRGDYNKQAAEILTDFEAIKRRTNISKEELEEVYCTRCNKSAQKGNIVKYKCSVCSMEINRRNVKLSKRRLKCLNECAGILEIINENEFYYCDGCRDLENEKILPKGTRPHNIELWMARPQLT